MVYFIKQENRDQVKIGTTCNISKRKSALQSGNPNDLEVILQINGDRELEQQLHKRFEKYKISREWFIFSGEIQGFVFGYNSCLNSNRNLQLDFSEDTERSKINKTRFDQSFHEKLRSQFFQCRIDEVMHENLMYIAKNKGMSVSELTATMLKCAIDVYEKCEV